MQAVDVLCDKSVQRPALLQGSQSQMAGIRLRSPCRVFESRLPCRLSHFSIRRVVADIGHLFRRRIAGPQALWATEVRYSRIGGYSSSGKRDDTLRLVDPLANGLTGLRCHRSTLAGTLAEGVVMV